jgi:exopolysaccharide biosynthesis predicted pyruvyltransferase EpsI
MQVLSKAAQSDAKIVIQGPQTIYDEPAFIEQKVLPAFQGRRVPDLHFLAREARSYETLRKFFPSDVAIGLDHDTATNLSRDDFPSYESKSYDFHAIRADSEVTQVSGRNWFVLRADPVAPGIDFEKWLQLHGEASTIVTNRLHSSIAGMTFGKPTTLLPNSYYKNREVWEYSLKSRGVLWGDKIEVNAINSLISRHRALRWLFGSAVAQKMIHARLKVEL